MTLLTKFRPTKSPYQKGLDTKKKKEAERLKAEAIKEKERLKAEAIEAKQFKASDASPIIAKRSYKCMVLNHPDLDIDIKDATFNPDGVIPAQGSLILNDKIHPILVYAASGDTTGLAPAKGNLTLSIPRGKWGILPAKIVFELPENWWYLTPEYIYAKTPTPDKPEPVFQSAIEFINSLADGSQYDTLSDMGPAQFGQDLAMAELDRQLRKEKTAAMSESLRSTYKSILWGLIAVVTLFGIILFSGNQ